MNLRRERHSVASLLVHLVFTIKYRRPILSCSSWETIKQSFDRVAEQMNFRIIEFNVESDHIDAVVEYPAKLSISTIVNHLQGVSSRMYGKAGYKKPHDHALWIPSYFAASVGGAPLSVLKEYIQNQKSP